MEEDSTTALLLPGTLTITDSVNPPMQKLFDNTLESTRETRLRGDASSSGSLSSCHNVPKTFQNAHTCRPSTVCSPVTYRDASVLLNHSSLLIFRQLTKTYRNTLNHQMIFACEAVWLLVCSPTTISRLWGRYIYAVTGLRLTEDARSPCVGYARWRKLFDGPCGADETALDNATKATLAQAIRSSTDAANPSVRDVIPNTVSGGTCIQSSNGVSTTGAKVNVDGSCWEH